MNQDVFAIQRAFPQIWHACHTGHRKGATDVDKPSERDVSILAHLDPRRPTTAGELARHLGIVPSTLSAALDDLERHGYVVRAKNAGDRRIVDVRLTDCGAEAVSADSALDPQRLAQILARLGDAERRAAVAGLEILARAAVDAVDAWARTARTTSTRKRRRRTS